MDPKNKAIVVGVDIGPSSDRAILMALDLLARDSTAVMHVITAIDPREIVEIPEKPALETEQELIAVLPKVLSGRVGALAAETGRSFPLARVHTHARLGNALEVIRQTCVDYDADLLIVGTHGRKGLDRLLLGSVAERLVRSANCPVLIAREKSYEGIARTPLPDAPYSPGETPGHYLSDAENHVTSTQMDGWVASDAAPTGIRIV